jgi:hypothetical protein
MSLIQLLVQWVSHVPPPLPPLGKREVAEGRWEGGGDGGKMGMGTVWNKEQGGIGDGWWWGGGGDGGKVW